ncbi:MAG: RluA family pseudouridine synthase [Bacilli bacterium]
MKQYELQFDVIEDGEVLKDFLRKRGISRQALTDIKSDGLITVDGVHRTVRYTLKKGERVRVVFPLEKLKEAMTVEYAPLEVCYEDDHLLVVNKPPGLKSIPDYTSPSGSLANQLLGYYASKGIVAAPHLVNRLDRDTSGTLVIAKWRYVHHLLSGDEAMKNISRTYVAWAAGAFSGECGTIDAPIGRSEDSIITRMVRTDGQRAVTHWRKLDERNGYTKLELVLETGRTHQIRVHLAHMGAPIVGDTLYGTAHEWMERQALHSMQTSFSHPISGEMLRVSACLPDDFVRFERWLQKSATR